MRICLRVKSLENSKLKEVSFSDIRRPFGRRSPMSSITITSSIFSVSDMEGLIRLFHYVPSLKNIPEVIKVFFKNHFSSFLKPSKKNQRIGIHEERKQNDLKKVDKSFPKERGRLTKSFTSG